MVMHTSLSSASTTSASATVTAGATISGIVAQAKVEVSGTITQSTTTTATWGVDRNVSAGKYGNLQFGSFGYHVGWRYYYDGANCTTILKSSGTAKVPTNALGWKCWEVN